MTCKEMIEYLSEFEPEQQVSIVVINPKERIHHKISEVYFIEDVAATFLIITKESEPFDDSENTEDET